MIPLQKDPRSHGSSRPWLAAWVFRSDHAMLNGVLYSCHSEDEGGVVAAAVVAIVKAKQGNCLNPGGP